MQVEGWLSLMSLKKVCRWKNYQIRTMGFFSFSLGIKVKQKKSSAIQYFFNFFHSKYKIYKYVLRAWDISASVQFSSVAQLCPTYCDSMNCSTSGLPVHHQLPEFTQTQVHQVSDAIQPFHPLSSPCPSALNPSQHQSFPMSQFFAWGGQSTGVSALASFLPKNTQDWSPFEWTGWISLLSKGLSRVFSSTVRKHQFFGAQPSLWSNCHIHTWLLEKP